MDSEKKYNAGWANVGKGRPAGSKNKKTIVKEQLLNCRDTIQKVNDGTWVSPLSFLLELVNDEEQEIDTRIDAASKALPYLHAKQRETVDTNVNVVADYSSIIAALSKSVGL